MYSPVPPTAVTVAVPVPPLHTGFTLAVILAVSSGGSVKVIVAVVVHPLASVTVTVYNIPPDSPVPVAPVPPVGAQA